MAFLDLCWALGQDTQAEIEEGASSFIEFRNPNYFG
jgi:hypothetical protein